MKIINIFSFIFLLMVAACGNENRNSAKESNDQPREIFPLEGRYRALIRPINTEKSKIVSGKANFDVDALKMNIHMVVDDAQNVEHRQAIHMGPHCPNAKFDRNRDGIIDAGEIQDAVGESVLTLDKNLGGSENLIYPVGSSYIYKKQGSFAAIGKEIPLESKVVVIYGVNEDANLPIACGPIKRISN
jgi:hypothetical protein